MASSDSTIRSAPLRAIIWLSVSTKEQIKEDKASLPEQEREARAIAEREAWHVVDILCVPGHSRRYIDIHECSRDMLANGINAFDRLIQHWNERDFDVLIVRDGDRFARTQALHAYVVERTISECNARIFVTTKGWIDRRNFRMFTAMDGYAAAAHVDGLVQKGQDTKNLRTSRGVPTAAYTPYSHVAVRDPSNGRRTGIVVDESKRRLFDDVAALLLQGWTWDTFEKELYRRFGHTDSRTGVPFKTQFFYRLLRNPWFWGNAARGYNDYKTNGIQLDVWAFDESVPVPAGVTVWRNTHESVYTGEQAALVQAELRRRCTSIRGTARSHRTHKFSGLLLCGSCGYHMGHSIADKKYHYYRCFSKYKDRSRPACTIGRTISENKVQRWIDARLRQMLESGDYTLLAHSSTHDTPADHVATLQTEIVDLEAKTRRLILNQAAAPDALASLYSEELKAFAERLTILRSALGEAKQRAARADMRPVERAFENLSDIGLEAFWAQDTTAINQMLHRLLRRRRLVVMDCEITGMADEPPRPY